MKVLRTLSFAMVIALALASCGSEKKTVSNKSSQSPSNLHLCIPCSEIARDDAEHYRILGIGDGRDKNSCIRTAIDNAQQIMHKKIINVKKRACQCSLYDKNLNEYSNTIEIYNDISIICQEIEQDISGLYHGYVTIEVAKKEIKHGIINELNRISIEQNLGIDFREEKFVNYMDEIMSIE